MSTRAQKQKAVQKKVDEANKPKRTKWVTRYIVEFQEGLNEPEFFACQADNASHAAEQVVNAYPDCQILAIFKEVVAV